MAGHGGSEMHFEGWQKIFNTYTHRGRLNCAYVSAGFWVTVFVAVKFWPGRRQKAIIEKAK